MDDLTSRENVESLEQLIAHNIAWDGLQDVDREAYRLSMATLRALRARLAEVERERDEWKRQAIHHNTEHGKLVEELRETRARVAAAYKEAARQARRRAEIYDEGDTNNAISDILWGLVVRLETLATPEETDALDRIRAGERERCAKIADGYNQDPYPQTEYDRGWAGAAQSIAEAIREDKT